MVLWFGKKFSRIVGVFIVSNFSCSRYAIYEKLRSGGVLFLKVFVTWFEFVGFLVVLLVIGVKTGLLID